MDIDKNKIIELSLNDVLPNRFQPRIKFREDSIIELADSIKTHGVIQPIIVRPLGDKYEIIAGERRYKACLLAGISSIPSRVINYNDKDSAEIALIENVQRRNLNPIEEAISYSKILDMGYLTQEQLATKLGMSQSTIANKKRLLNLCDEVQEALMEEKISERHARSLLKIKESSEQRNMLKRIIKERLTVRRLDEEIKLLLNKESNTIEEKNIMIDKKVIEEEKEDYLDITNLIDESELQTFIDSISNPLKAEKEEIKENDTMMNNLQDFSQSSNNFGENNGNFFSNSFENFNSDKDNQNFINTIKKMDALMAPEEKVIGLGDNNLNNYDSIFSSTTQSQNISNSNDIKTGESDSETMFSNLMKPSSDNENNTYIDGDTFSKFLDPSYIDGAKKQDLIQETNEVDSSVFSKFLDKEISTNDEKIDTKIVNENSQINNQNIFNNQDVETANESNVTLFNENKFQGQSELLRKDEFLTTKESKPDFLAPMNFDINSNTQVNLMTNDLINDNVSNSLLTPDNSLMSNFNNINASNDGGESNESVSIGELVNSNQEKPIFIRASGSDYDKNEIPTNPIIENSDMSKLLTLNTEKNEFETVSNKISNEFQSGAELENRINSELQNSDSIEDIKQEISSQIENRPIIITDYNKQYDPVLPSVSSQIENRVDLRQIINMIRELSDKIENYGYTIDTEEIDLSDSYQVIFNIEKNR